MGRNPSRSAALEETIAAQRAAADPAASAWVSANAGAGKTHVLVARLVRLLLAGTAPERILCLTFTKAAAAEMASRVFARLARWVTAEDEALAGDIADLCGRAATADELARARDLFALAMETPGGLKVQTIHAFSERLLQRFPLEAGVPPEFTILDDRDRNALRREARDDVLMDAVADPDGRLGRAHTLVVGRAAETSYESLLAAALGRRDLLQRLDRSDEPDIVGRILRDALGVRTGVTRDDLTMALAGVLPAATAERARALLAASGKRDQERARDLAAAAAATSEGMRIAALRDFFLTGKGEPRESLMTKKVAADNAALAEALADAQAAFARLLAERDALDVVEASLALATIAAAVEARYTALKRGRSALDFEDLIRHAGSLLADSEGTEWVLFKLDGGLDHILIDEAQDTNPGQWRLVEALAREFFSGAGARDAGTARTVFAVGDEKQSIYGFQGAEPRLFAEQGRSLGDLAAASGGQWRQIPLTLSFRTVSPVLEAVDRVFADAQRTPGVRASAGLDSVRHVTNRPGIAGHVELWEPERGEPADPGDPWAASPAAEAEIAPAERVADRIASTIAGWLASGTLLASEGRPIRAGDILVLVRKRRPLADAVVRALERHRVPVAGADRMRLTDQLAVQDLIALCRFLLLPEDDLSLATVLKSPFFDLDDDDLVRIAPQRTGTLWRALLAAAETDARLRRPAEQLKRWRARADTLPPFEMLSEILDHDGMRQRLLARLGTEAADAIDQVLTLAIAYDEEAPPSLEGFIAAIVGAEHEIKRDMEQGRDEVRVLTVHGAKGLEAPIVFLPDTCSAPAAPRGLIDLIKAPRPEGMPAPFIWPLAGSGSVAGVAVARQAVLQRETEESHRLLYVALTRARDRLYIAGFHGRKGRPAGCWYDLVAAALPDLEAATDDAGRPVRRLTSPQTLPTEPSRGGGAAIGAVELPDWARRRAPPEPMRLVPLAPSQIAPLDTDAEGEPVERGTRESAPPLQADAGTAPDGARAAAGMAGKAAAGAAGTGDGDQTARAPATAKDDLRFLRGTVTHALLEHLPGRDPATSEAAAEAFVAVRGAGLSRAARRSIVSETLAVLGSPALAPLFGPDSRAEVSIVAEIEPPSGKGPTVRLTGQIDRLVRLPDRVLVVDYKTNRPSPRALAEVPEAYVLQLAAYRLALARIFPGLTVEAMLLWTDGPRVMAIPAAMLDAAEPRLFAAATA